MFLNLLNFDVKKVMTSFVGGMLMVEYSIIK